MGTVLSFGNRVLGSGQWTASERSRLDALTERFFGGGEKVQVVFGATDDGAPWCAVTNQDDEVLVHVARVADQFLVHFVTEDVMAKGANLREALGQWLSPEPDRIGVVVPFSRVSNGANLLVLLAVANFLEDQLRLIAPHLAETGAWLATDPPADDPVSTPGPDTADRASDEEAAPSQAPSETPASPAATTLSSTQAEVPDQAAPRVQNAGTPEVPASAESDKPDFLAAAPKETPREVQGDNGDNLLVGGPWAERLTGGPGNDLLIGGGGRDTLDGGPGDDRIVLTAEAVANGGAGADTFVISAPAVMDHPDTLLGTILDFNAGQGDRLVAHEGERVFPSAPDGQPSVPGFTSQTDIDQRVQIDFDGDGRADGYVLLTAASSHVAVTAGPVELVETASDWAVFVG